MEISRACVVHVEIERFLVKFHAPTSVNAVRCVGMMAAGRQWFEDFIVRTNRMVGARSAAGSLLGPDGGFSCRTRS